MELKSTPAELGTKKIGTLLKQYAIPAIIAMTATSLYNITDSIFIGHGIGPLGIAGLSISFPLMNLAAAFGSLIGAGGATLLSIRLGQKDYDSANKILGNVVSLNVILGAIFSILTLIFLDPILRIFGASDNILPYAREYMQVLLAGNIISHLYIGINSMLRSAGMPEKAMYATIATVVINIILNALFIFVFKLGIRGAALATIISQLIVLIWLLKFFSNKDFFLHFSKKSFYLMKKIILDIFSIGLAPFFLNAAACLITIILNNGLAKYGGDMAVSAYGIVNRISFLFIMIVMGLNQALQPIAGYNFGAKQYERVTEVLKKTILWATLVMALGFVLIELFPRTVASIFTQDESLIAIAAKGLQITFVFFPIVGFQMVTSNFFQSIGMAGKAIFMSLSRQLLFLLPLLFILPNFYGIDGIWFSLPASDLIASVVAFSMLMWQFKQFKKMKSSTHAN